jgi:hypothetical protein
MKKTRKSNDSRCVMKNITLKNINKKTILKKSFDLFDIKYISPIKKDLAIGLVYFNCIKSKRILMNYLYVVEKLKMANIPFYTIEMYEETPELFDAIHVKTDFILFQKERLCYILEKHIPDTYTKLLFIDSDLIFENPNWYNEISDKLDRYDIVQPFSKGIWLDITYKKIVKERIPMVFYKKLGLITNEGGIGGYHPGFAWGFKRDWYRKVGFFNYGILGCGDTLSSTVFLNYTHYTPVYYIQPAYEEYKKLVKSNKPTVCYVNGNIYHLWHGDSKNRQYSTRREIFNNIKDIRDIITVDKTGLFKLKTDKYKKSIRKYFMNRFDDGLEVTNK